MDLKTVQRIKTLVDSLDLDSYQLTLVSKDNTKLHVEKSSDIKEEKIKVGF